MARRSRQSAAKRFVMSVEAVPIKGGILIGASASAVRRKRRLVCVDESHGFGCGIAAVAAILAARQCFHAWQEALRDKFRSAAQPLAVRAKSRMRVETIAPAGTSCIRAGEGRIGIVQLQI